MTRSSKVLSPGHKNIVLGACTPRLNIAVISLTALLLWYKWRVSKLYYWETVALVWYSHSIYLTVTARQIGYCMTKRLSIITIFLWIHHMLVFVILWLTVINVTSSLICSIMRYPKLSYDNSAFSTCPCRYIQGCFVCFEDEMCLHVWYICFRW